jgi:hypothetical protein
VVSELLFRKLRKKVVFASYSVTIFRLLDEGQPTKDISEDNSSGKRDLVILFPEYKAELLPHLTAMFCYVSLLKFCLALSFMEIFVRWEICSASVEELK